MWEAARGMLLYGWFYYAIYAMGEHQLGRVADAAVLHRYQQAGGPPNKKRGPEGELRWPDLMTRVDWLISADVIPTEKRDRWGLVRGLRNETTYASIRHLTTPHEALRVLELLAVETTLCSRPSPAWTQTRPSREIAGEIVAPVRNP
jgi:hypothetical protein